MLARNIADYESLAGVEVLHGDLLSRSDCGRFAASLKLIYYLAHNNTPEDSDFDCAPKQDGVFYLETDRCAPLSSYGIQKLAAEEYLRLGALKGYLTSTILRVGNAYGTPLSQFRMQGLIGVAVNCVAQGRPVRVFGNPNNVRDYIHLEDLSEIAVRGSIPRQPFSIINVGSGVGHSVLDILRMIEELWGKPIDIHSDQTWGNWLTDWVVLDNGKAREEFGWTPEIDLRCGIARMLDGLN